MHGDKPPSRRVPLAPGLPRFFRPRSRANSAPKVFPGRTSPVASRGAMRLQETPKMDFDKDMQEMAAALQLMLQKRQSISDMDASLLTLMKGQLSINTKLLEELKKTNQ